MKSKIELEIKLTKNGTSKGFIIPAPVLRMIKAELGKKYNVTIEELKEEE
jgi:antitoxin component of MazEF toxin-antitoxin module